MRTCIQSWFLACCMLLLGTTAVLAQPGPCDPAALPNQPGSCQAPNSDFPNGGPGCYVCQAGTIGGPPNTCVPNDAFCEGISGGNASNECRAAICLDAADIEFPNFTGCDYQLDTAADDNCVLCNSPEPVPFNHCGNGVCETGNETFDNCSIDCRVPGFTGDLLPDGDPVLDGACDFPEPQLVFNGPPFNDPAFQGFAGCEDGDICTDNVCVEVDGTEFCDVTPKSCNPDSDFCCPSGCAAPAPGGTCREVTGAPIAGCDPDCYVPEECGVPTPTPTPSPTPPANLLLEGSGCSLGGLAGSSSALAWIAGFGLLTAFGVRRRG